MNPKSQSRDNGHNGGDESVIDDVDPGRSGSQRPVNPTRMVYEDELRREGGQRLLDDEQLRRWLEIRRQLPINRWIDRNRVMQADRSELVALKAEIEQLVTLFSQEAKEYELDLDMGRNYYRAAVKLMSGYGQGAALNVEDSRLLSGLMVMVDLKDARLAIQILASIA